MKRTAADRLSWQWQDDPPKQNTEQQEGYQVCSDCK